ncbi:RICIN domain-containing protein [Kibdelosporangium philippinense]|uniref:RICIN domain-containing protein n=1 Tax=Kibdelosporangium philippinense TaxID=211113 RepID=A0ABS8ZT31_9PSEU|nr:RICIN domain-containing protein [Kibdelosporangium philippinense]MCE7010150.1 RICIN domain-containing protein [Kibdelosporangium philippinense]
MRFLATVGVAALLLASGGTAEAADETNSWRSVVTDLCLDGTFDKQLKVSIATQAPCNPDNWFQQWTQRDLGNGYWMLESVYQCLRNADGVHAEPPPADRVVQLVPCDPANERLWWSLVPRGNEWTWRPKVPRIIGGSQLCLSAMSPSDTGRMTTTYCDPPDTNRVSWRKV